MFRRVRFNFQMIVCFCVTAIALINPVYGIDISTPGLSIHFDNSGIPYSLTNSAGQELLNTQISEGFYLLESDGSTRRFDTIYDIGGGSYYFAISSSPEAFIAKFDGADDYMTVHFTHMEGFALAREKLKFKIFTNGEAVQALALDYMVSVRNIRTFVELDRVSLWETSATNALGAFALYEYVDPAQEDETLLDLWVDEGLPHPKVEGVWDRAAAEAWLEEWIDMAYDTSYLNIVPDTYAEHYDYLPYAEKMSAKAMYLWNLIWRGEYWLRYRQNDEINPNMYPNGLTDMEDFRDSMAAEGMNLMFHYLCGNIGEEDPEFCKTTVSPDLQSWGTVALNSAVSASATSFIVTPDAGVEMPIISTSSSPIEAPPVIPSSFEFKTFRIGSEWVSASSVTDLGNGTWQLSAVSRGKWNTGAQSYSAGTSLRGYLRPYNQDFVPDTSSPLLETIASRWATLSNTLGLVRGSFDGFEIHKAAGEWGSQKFAALIYENLDHPVSANTSSGVPPKAWLEYKFNKVKDVLGGDFQTREHFGLFLGDKSRIAPGMEEFAHRMNKFLDLNNRGFSIGSYDVKGVALSTLASHGLTDEVLEKLKNWKNACLPMSAAQRESMDVFRPYLGARVPINGNHPWGTALWRLDGLVFRKWYALGTDIYTHEWHFGQEHGTITPRFYVQNGDTQTLEVPGELGSGVDQVRIIGRMLPRFDVGSSSNINLMSYIGSSSITVSRTNTTSSDVWSDTSLTSYTVSPLLNMENNRGLGFWLTGDGSGATLIIRIYRNGTARDYAVSINFTGQKWIEIPTGEQAWRVRDWGWALATRKYMDYRYVNQIGIGIGYIPANTICNVALSGLTAMSEIKESMVSPTITLGEQSVNITGTIDTENHFILDPDGTFTIYDELWNVVYTEQLGSGLLPSNLSSFRIQSGSSSSIWLEVGVQASNETIANPDPNVLVWDGGGSNDSWGTARNWDPNGVPSSGDNVTIGSGASVINGQDDFASLNIQSGAAVTFNEVLSGKDITISGTLDDSFTTAMRFIDCTINLSGNLGAGMSFLDTNGSTINFVDGAAFLNPSAMDFEMKMINTYGYKLSEEGFTALVADVLRNSTHSDYTSSWSDVTFNIDISDYDISNGTRIVLADYSSVVWIGDDRTFDPTVNIITGNSDLDGSLSFDDVNSDLVLTVWKASDINGDGWVNFKDLAKLESWWGDKQCQTSGDCMGADINRDGEVDIEDIESLAKQWLQ
ncbi:MAG: hypothetical protein ISS77_01845 [Phycisphaerae bacterium]|nr:hypothetical protein [Phycisphaerae bacterium]